MTQKVHPTQGEASSQLTSGAIKWAAQGDWVVPSGEDYLGAFAGLSGTPLHGFQESHGADSLDVTVDTGEAFVGGRWCAKDMPTTVTLTKSTTTQTVYLGWEASTANSVVIGLDTAFSSSDDGRRMAIWEFDTDGSGVTNATNVHNTEPIHPHAKNADELAGTGASEFAKLDESETITGSWTFDSDMDVNGNIDASNIQLSNDINDFIKVSDGSGGTNSSPHVLRFDDRDFRMYSGTGAGTLLNLGQDGNMHLEQGNIGIHNPNSHLSLFESDNNNKEWRIEAQSGDFRIVEPGVEEWLRIDAAQGNRVEAPGGIASQSLRLSPQSSEPNNPQHGILAVQDGNNWDPAGTGNLDLVVYLGGSWEQAT